MKRKPKPQAVKPSPLPLNIGEDGDIFGHDGVKCVALVMDGPEETEEAKALAALIVLAVNAHTALLRIAKARVYAGHDGDCKAQYEGKTCDCGHADARAALRASGEKV